MSWCLRPAIIALLVNPKSPNAETVAGDLQAAARALGLQVHTLQAATERDFETCLCCDRPDAGRRAHDWS